MKIYTRQDIERLIDIPFLMEELEKGFVLFSSGKSQTAVSALTFASPPGDVHIKSGYVEDGEYYVVKIASSFYHNQYKNLPNSQGMMALFSQETGKGVALLLDEGYLTDLRTALAGAICAKYLAPSCVHKIGIIGTGTQAKAQLYHLQHVTGCREVIIWGRDGAKVDLLMRDSTLSSFRFSKARDVAHLAEEANLIVTTTPSTLPLLFGHHLHPNTHVTAVGADSQGKQELDRSVFEKASLVVLDSKAQCAAFGDFSHAKAHYTGALCELGELIARAYERPKNSMTIADLTGIATQDLQIAKAIYLKGKKHD